MAGALPSPGEVFFFFESLTRMFFKGQLVYSLS